MTLALRVFSLAASSIFSEMVNADNRVRPLFRGVNEMPAIAAANVQVGFPFEVRQQAFQRLLFTRAAKPLYGAVHLTVFRWGRGHAFLTN